MRLRLIYGQLRLNSFISCIVLQAFSQELRVLLLPINRHMLRGLRRSPNRAHVRRAATRESGDGRRAGGVSFDFILYYRCV